MGASPDVLQTAFDMAVLGRQGDPRELKGVSDIASLPLSRENKKIELEL